MEQPPVVAWRSGDFTIVPAERRLLLGGETVDVEAKAFDLIVLLVAEHGRALDKRELIDTLWGRRPVTDAALSQLVHRARRALGDDGERQAMIRTVYGRGLQWVAQVVPVPVPSTASLPSAVEPGLLPRRSGRWLLVVALVLVVAVLMVVLRMPGSTANDPLPRLAMLPIDNATGDPAFDWIHNGLPGLIGSLIDESGVVDVDDALQVAQASDFLPIPGRSPAERLRFVTGAAVLVSGRLRRLGEALYELDLKVDSGGTTPGDPIVVTGADPAQLGVDAAARILRLLEPAARVDATTEHALSGDAWLAQTFARGLDLAQHGDWANAKTYFALCVQNAPGFLPARLQLGQAQASTRDLAASETTLRGLAEEARQRRLPAMQAAALVELADNAFRRGDRRAALLLLEDARAPAQAGGDADIQVRRVLLAARAHAILQQPVLARQYLDQARALIDGHALRQRAPLLYRVEEQVAAERRDYPAQETAIHAALRAAEAIGDERMVIEQTYRLGRMRAWQERPFEALPLLARAWQRARERKLLDIELPAGVELGWVLSETGHYDQACAVAGRLVDEAAGQPNAYWKAIALAARARCERGGGDAVRALASYRAVRPLVDRREDPGLDALVWQYEALAAYSAAPADLPAIRAGVEAAGNDVAYRHVRRLVAALDAASRGDLPAAITSLEAEAADPDGDDGQGNELRRVALHIALATGSQASAQIAARGNSLLASNDVEVLRLYADWCAHSGDEGARRQAQARIEAMRDGARQALDGIDPGLSPVPPAGN